MVIRSLTFFLVVLFLVSFRVSAQGEMDPLFPGGSDEVTGEAVVDQSMIPAGGSFRVALTLGIPMGWHIYGNPVGQGSGRATLVKVVPKEGFTFGPTLYLPPEKLKQPESGPDAWVWVYEFQTRLFLEVRTVAGLPPGAHDLSFRLDALACKESCLPVDLVIPLRVQVGVAGGAVKFANQEVFKDFGRATAAPAEVKEVARVETPVGGSIARLEEAEAQDFIKQFQARKGEDEISNLWMAIILGFIAGVILNIMPCVLPVISIKILSFVQQAGEDRQRIFKLGLAFSGGIIFVFMILAWLAAFAGEGWGEQFQDSRFLIAMIALVFAFSLSMFDLYTLSLPGFVSKVGQEEREGYLGAFSKGMLATALATPCSGPFLGSTLAWVMGQPSLVIFTIFTSIGLGMASPYLILTANPVFLKFVPKPGNWMIRFREFMGFILLATVVYLLTIVPSHQAVWVVSFCLFIAIGAWIYGKLTGPWKPQGHRFFWRSTAVLVIAFGGWLSFSVLMPLYAGTGKAGGAEVFSLARLKHHLEEGRSVVVDWTADWCPNCKFVERVVLHADAVEKKMKEKGIVFMIADITRDRPRAKALMNKLGSQSIPFLGIFPASKGFQPWVLRDIYSQADLLKILNQIP